MALNLLRGEFVLGIAVGVAAAIMIPAMWRAGRPLAKEAIKTGLVGYSAGQTAVAKVVDEVAGLVAEASREVGAETDGRAPALLAPALPAPAPREAAPR